MQQLPQIAQDFYKKERSTLLLLSLVLEGFLIFLALLLPAPLLILGGPLLLAVRLLLLSKWVLPGFCRQLEGLEPSRRQRLLEECAQPHPTFKLYQGELHLLSDCLICRSRRSMFVLPLEDISYLQRIGHQHSATLIKDLFIKTNRGKNRHLEMIGSQGRELDHIITMVVARRRALGIGPDSGVDAAPSPSAHTASVPTLEPAPQPNPDTDMAETVEKS